MNLPARCALLLASAPCITHAAGKVSWNFDVRPLLAAKCFSCHGPDEQNRKGKLRLDSLNGLAEGIIVPGKAEASSLIQRLHSRDPDEVMPPPEKSGPLTAAEVDLLNRWINEGAEIQKHWAFVPPVKPEIPRIPGLSGQGPIDALVAAEWPPRQLQGARPATRRDWLRRVSFALTGLPPEPEQLAAWLAAPEGPEADAAVVDQLLASPHFGERLAQDWLDAARYGDTYGRHEDADSNMWPWRDWVIRAFNNNLPYDQFVLWQTAGDLLPQATQEQRIATAFNRLCVQSNESGSNPEEFRWDQVFDRVKTNATVFMGLTLACAQCHDHKYDPFSQQEYYQFASWFDNIDELGLFSRFSNGTPSPAMLVYAPGQEAEHARLKAAIQDAEDAMAAVRKDLSGRYADWRKSHAPPGRPSALFSAVLAGAGGRQPSVIPAPSHYLSFDLIDTKAKQFKFDIGGVAGTSDNASSTPVSGRFGFGAGLPVEKDKKYEFPGVAEFRRTDAFTFSFWLKLETPLPRAVILHRCRAGLDAAHRGYELTLEGGKLTATLANFYPGNAIRVETEQTVDFQEWKQVAWTYDGSSRASGLRLYVDGQLLKVRSVKDQLSRDILYLKEWGDVDNNTVADAKDAELISLQIGGRNLDKSLRGAVFDDLKVYDRALSPAEAVLLSGKNQPLPEEAWLDWYAREVDTPCREAAARLQEAREAENQFTIKIPELMVMEERPGSRRPTPVLARGNYASPGDHVEPGVPAALGAWPEGVARDRQGLARWLTAKEHPLTARVQVNRLWRLFFGRGLVATAQDFGIQGSPPSHPALLDWLAVHFQESGWDIKKLCREIALTRVFRQSSMPAQPGQDPDNRWLARGPRLRLPAEQIRDAAMAVSGLLSEKVGGPSVKPWQPAGLWEESGTQHIYVMDQGDALRRRSLYTFWRRTCPPPLLSAFDAPSREFCLAQREESLTPLQTLAVLNDAAFLQSSRALAARILTTSPEPASLIPEAYARTTGLTPTAAQVQPLEKLHQEALAYYQSHPNEAAQLLAAGSVESADAPVTTAVPDTAALMVVCRALFSSDEFLRTW